MDYKNMIDANSLSSVLGVSRRHVYRLVAAGEIPAIKVGGVMRFDAKEVIAKLKANTTQQGSK